MRKKKLIKLEEYLRVIRNERVINTIVNQADELKEQLKYREALEKYKIALKLGFDHEEYRIKINLIINKLFDELKFFIETSQYKEAIEKLNEILHQRFDMHITIQIRNRINPMK